MVQYGSELSRGWATKLHLVVDADYELPVAFEVTRASASDTVTGHELIDKIQASGSQLLDTTEVLTADRGYDAESLLVRLWDEHKIKPVIDIRNMWKDTDATRLVGEHDNVVHDYRCPVRHYGVGECKGQDRCRAYSGIRIPLGENRRLFTPLARCSTRWKALYRKRTNVERANSRLDVSFGFERHFIRGLAKMKLKCNLALCVMLALAVGSIREQKPERMRSLVWAV